MAFIRRRGITWSTANFFITSVVLVILFRQVDWGRHRVDINDFREREQDASLLPIETNDLFSVFVFFFSLSLVTMSIWYFLGKLIGPKIGIFLAKWFLSGINSQPYLDSSVMERKLPWTKFTMRFVNLTILMFALDLMIHLLFYFEPETANTTNPTHEFGEANLESFFYALIIIVILESSNWLLEDVGLRSYNEGYSEIKAVSSILEKYMFRILRTVALLASIGTISSYTGSVDGIAQALRTIFGRCVLMSILINFNFSLFYQPEAIKKDWYAKNVPLGKSEVKFHKE